MVTVPVSPIAPLWQTLARSLKLAPSVCALWKYRPRVLLAGVPSTWAGRRRPREGAFLGVRGGGRARPCCRWRRPYVVVFEVEVHPAAGQEAEREEADLGPAVRLERDDVRVRRRQRDVLAAAQRVARAGWRGGRRCRHPADAQQHRCQEQRPRPPRPHFSSCVCRPFRCRVVGRARGAPSARHRRRFLRPFHE